MPNFQYRRLPGNLPGKTHPKSFHYARPYQFEDVLFIDGHNVRKATKQDRELYPDLWRAFDSQYAQKGQTPIALLLVDDPVFERTIDDITMSTFNSIEFIAQQLTTSELAELNEKQPSPFERFDLSKNVSGEFTDEVIALCRAYIAKRQEYKALAEHTARLERHAPEWLALDPQLARINARGPQRPENSLQQQHASVILEADTRSVDQIELDRLAKPAVPVVHKDYEIEQMNARIKSEAEYRQKQYFGPTIPPHLNEFRPAELAHETLRKEHQYPNYAPAENGELVPASKRCLS